MTYLFKVNNEDMDARDYVVVANICYSSSTKVEIIKFWQ